MNDQRSVKGALRQKRYIHIYGFIMIDVYHVQEISGWMIYDTPARRGFMAWRFIFGI